MEWITGKKSDATNVWKEYQTGQKTGQIPEEKPKWSKQDVKENKEVIWLNAY